MKRVCAGCSSGDQRTWAGVEGTLASVRFTITQPHSISTPPLDAIALLWEQLQGVQHEDLAFALAGSHITATASDDPKLGMARDEWIDTCRRRVVKIGSELCERSETLDWNWFAVSTGE
jgi:hypothetical protein